MRYLFLSLLLTITYQNIYSQNVNQGLVGYWPMNCNLLDSTDNQNHGIQTDSYECDENGRLREAVILDGIDDYIKLPDDQGLKYVSAEGFSWSIWFKSDDIPTGVGTGIHNVLISFLDDELGNDIYLGFGSPNTASSEITFVVDAPGGAGNSAQANNAIMHGKPDGEFQADTWYHACGIRDYDNNYVKLYLDGVLIDSTAYTERPFDEAQPMQFGAFNDNIIEDHFFNGSIDEVRVYERVLTTREVLILATARPEQVKADTNLVDFGNIKCLASESQTITIKNEGPSEFDISDIRQLSGEAFNINLSNSFTLADQEEVNLIIDFIPPSQGTFTDTLYLDNTFGVQPLIIFMEGEKEVEIELTDTLDFGEIVNCESELSKTLSLEIQNGNIDEDLIISEILFSHSAFTVSNTFEPISISNSSSITVEFSPLDLGVYDESATIVFENCDLNYEFSVLGNFTFPSSTYPSIVDFEGVEIATTDSKTITFINDGTTNLNYSGFELNHPEFSASELDVNGVIEPGDSISFKVDFTPVGGPASTTFNILSQSKCDLVPQINPIVLNGVGKYRTTFDLAIRPFKASNGDFNSLYLELSNAINLLESEIDTLSFELKYNQSMLLDLENLETIEEDGVYRTVPYSVLIDNSQNKQSIELSQFKAVLGNKDLDSLWIEITDTHGAIVTANISTSDFYFDDICEAGDTKRLFLSSEFLELNNVVPNPADDNVLIEFSIIETGKTKLYLLNNFGVEEKVFFNEDLEKGKYSANYDISDIPIGSYFLIMETPTQVKTTRLIKQ